MTRECHVRFCERLWGKFRRPTHLFVFGFEKNVRSNISGEELEALQNLAADLLSRTAWQLNAAVADGALTEICHDSDKQA